MSYDPFARGPHPVGVRSDAWTDGDRDRSLPVEVWYPAAPAVAGRDLDPATQDAFAPGWATSDQEDAGDLVRQAAVRDAPAAGDDGNRPLVLLVHGWAGFRREATFAGTHLASHGYVVVSPDVLGSTWTDVDAFLAAQEPRGSRAALVAHMREIARLRRGDVPFLVSAAIDRLGVRPTGVGVTGASFGGWSALAAPALDERIAAIVPMCPAGGTAPAADHDPNHLRDELPLDWPRPVPTLVLAADRDALLPLHGQLDLLRRIPADDKRLVVLADADHNHFVDDIDLGQAWLREYAERVARLFPDGPGDWPLIARSVVPQEQLCPGAEAQLAWRGLLTAHFDAHLRGDGAARALLGGSLDALLAARGVTTTTIDGGRR